ncbi:alpha/beta hydrolase [Clostridium sp. C2-6-12]|uniref:alpha/beta fold hydrolase n=1 Tax=Clostridium sp. C2-6-12 TaxID=2698832 RepID=UPI00136CB152|nr:alpha/beta hydrolase [Clostridium sp. C2-6-12]
MDLGNMGVELFSDSSRNRSYIYEKNYKEEMRQKVEPYLQERLEYGYLLGKNNLKLYYEKFIAPNPKANIVICHGFGECTEKYYELIYYFMLEGYSVFIIQHRGHGKSQRLGIDESQINVEKFSYYVEDFKKFIDEIVIPNGNNKELLLFAHSMGGGIGTAFLEKYTEYFKAAVLSSPMHEINTGKISKTLACVISQSMKYLGMKKRYVPGQTPYVEKNDFGSSATSSRGRYEYLYEKIKNNKSYQSGGSSVLWYLESSKATKNLVKKENASKVKIPVLLLQTEYDTYVKPEAQNKFARYAVNCQLVKIKGSKHESYFEKDEIAFNVYNKIFLFYETNLK